MKTLGELITVIETLNGVCGSVEIRLNRIASDRWAIVYECDGRTRTLATGEDILAAYKKCL